MDTEQTRIQEDLRGLLDGEVRCDDLATQMYATDASIYQVRPVGVVYPKNRGDVAQCVQYAAENALPIFPRGGGSGVAGQSLGPGLVLDFSVHMRRIGQPDTETQTIRLEPGVVIADLNRRLEASGLLFGPDPATRSVSTIGSAIAIDSSGSHFPAYGSVGDTIESLDVVLASGQPVTLAQHNWTRPATPGDHVGRIAHEVGQLLFSNSKVIQEFSQRKLSHRPGYRMDSVVDDQVIDLARLQAGSEGTLAIVTGAKVRLRKIPEARAVVLLFFDRLETAAAAAMEARKDQVAACDLMDRRLLEIARETDKSYATILPRGAEASLLIEHQGDSPADVRKRLMALVNRIIKRAPKTIASRITTDATERNYFWRLSRRVIPRLYRLKGHSRPLPFVDAITLPPEKLPTFLSQMQSILQTQRVTATVFAHAAHGQIQIRPFLDMSDPTDIVRMRTLADALYESVIELGGVAAGENAIGLSRSWFNRSQMGELYPIAKRIKEVFDPDGLLNPGKMVTDAPQRINDNLRPIDGLDTLSPSDVGNGLQTVPSRRSSASVSNRSTNRKIAATKSSSDGSKDRLEPPAKNQSTKTKRSKNGSPKTSTASRGPTDPSGRSNDEQSTAKKLLPILNWSESNDLSYTTRNCNGCGRCRSNAPSERMCPMFRVDTREENSPRAKANVMRGVLSGNLDVEMLEGDELKELADTCFQCHQCRLDCPANVDIPKIVTEIKSQYVATNGLTLADLLLSRLDLLAAISSRFPHLANWSLNNPQMRWLFEKATGIAGSRRLPRISGQSFLRWAARRRLNRPKRTGGRKVLFFVDQYANWHNPLVGRAVVQVFQHQKVEVYVPSNQSPSWMAKIAMGDVRRARKLIEPNLRMLAESVRQGYTIVCIEPSATLALQHEYLNLFDTDEARLVSQNTVDAGQYLWQMHQQNQLELDFRPTNLNLLYHEPCHSRTTAPEQPGQRLLELIPGLNVIQADKGCSGMAGTFGLKRENVRTSLRIGRPLMHMFRDGATALGATECTACKLQMEQRTDKPTLHPLAILAYAYGLLPEVADWIETPNEGLLVR
jgi:FAD/FMN-containing dehydrogenase/Fe-S oxidoreductase